MVIGPGGAFGATGIFGAGGLGWATGAAASIASGAAAGFAAGGIQGGNLNSALSGAVSGGLFAAAGALTDPNTFASYATHAAAGCISGEASGGNCGSGAAGAVVGKLFTNMTDKWGPSPAQFAGVVIGGGVASKISGGTFESGALSAGLGYALNYCSSGKCDFGWEQALYDYFPAYKLGTGINSGIFDGIAPSGEEISDVASLFPGGGKLAQMAKGAAKGLSSTAPKSPNQLNAEIARGQAPDTIKRVDLGGKTKGEQTQVHFNDRANSALNVDGSWKHGGKMLTNSEKTWLSKNGWKLP